MQSDDTLSVRSVLARTSCGTQAIVAGDSLLDRDQLRLLLLANGFTPLQTFIELTGNAGELVRTAQRLIVEGLVEPVALEQGQA